MDLREATRLLRLRRETLIAAIHQGIELPKSKKKIKLLATPLGNTWDIEPGHLDEFLAAFEVEEPGRHPPIEIRRILLREARYSCPICDRENYLQYHHIVPWAEIRHHAVEHMIALCANCHRRVHMGDIDRQNLYEEKERLRERPRWLQTQEPTTPQISQPNPPALAGIRFKDSQFAFSLELGRNTENKRRLADVVADKVATAISGRRSLYLGPGTTVFTLYDRLTEIVPALDSYSKIFTSNAALALFLPAGAGLVGDRLLGEYPSQYFDRPELETHDTTFDVSLLGIAGLEVLDDTLTFRTCYHQQCRTVRTVALNTKRLVIIVADATKLATSRGNPYLDAASIREDIESKPGKAYTFAVSGITPASDWLVQRIGRQLGCPHTPPGKADFRVWRLGVTTD